MTSSMLRRQLKNLVQNYSEAEVKVREATSNDPWGPSSSQMADISDLTYNVVACNEIMTMLWKRLKDDRNWRHIHKSLTLLEYLLKTGDDRVLLKMKDNVYIVKALTEYRFVEKDGKDQGSNVREKAKVVLVLMEDDEKLKEERDFARKTREKTSKGSAASSTDTIKDPNYKPCYVPGAMGLPSLDNIPSVADLAASFAARKEERIKQETEKKEAERRAKLSEDELKWEDAGKGNGIKDGAWGGEAEEEEEEEEEVKPDAWGAPKEPKEATDPWGTPTSPDTIESPASSDPWGSAAKRNEDPFAAPKEDEDPFAAPKADEDPFAAPKADKDPFAAPKNGEDPFAAPKVEPDPFSASSDDPFNTSKDTSDPFNAQHKEDPFAAPKDKPDPFSSSNNDPFNTPKDDPFSSPQNDPFSAPQDDPFSTSKDDPFDTPKNDPFNAPKEDPFGTPKDDPFYTPKDDPFKTPTASATSPKEDPFAVLASPKDDPFTASTTPPKEDHFSSPTKPTQDDPFAAPTTPPKEDPFSAPVKDEVFSATTPTKTDPFAVPSSSPKDVSSDPFSAPLSSLPQGGANVWEPPAIESDPWGVPAAPKETKGADPWGDGASASSPIDNSDPFGDASIPDNDPWGAPAAAPPSDSSPPGDPFGDGASKASDPWGAPSNGTSNGTGKRIVQEDEMHNKMALLLGSAGASLVDLDNLFSSDPKHTQHTTTLRAQTQDVGTFKARATTSDPVVRSGPPLSASLFGSTIAPSPTFGAANPSPTPPQFHPIGGFQSILNLLHAAPVCSGAGGVQPLSVGRSPQVGFNPSMQPGPGMGSPVSVPPLLGAGMGEPTVGGGNHQAGGSQLGGSIQLQLPPGSRGNPFMF